MRTRADTHTDLHTSRPRSVDDHSGESLNKELEGFDVQNVDCFDQADKDNIIATMESQIGGTQDFNETIRKVPENLGLFNSWNIWRSQSTSLDPTGAEFMSSDPTQVPGMIQMGNSFHEPKPGEDQSIEVMRRRSVDDTDTHLYWLRPFLTNQSHSLDANSD